MLKILGLECSCDDSAASVVDSEGNILSNIVISQNHEHELFKGVVPEIAARSHLINLEKAINMATIESNINLNEIDAIAATSGPGLIGGVIVGSMYGKALSSTLGKPFIAINHLEGHALTPKLTNKVEFPYLLLLVSGGHCQFVSVNSVGNYKILGGTLDDAVGEAFDKVAKMMNLGFPGGPILEKIAERGDKNRFKFPRPLLNQKDCNMSFSGLKTAVKIQIDKISELSEQDKSDVAASFQEAVCDVVAKKCSYAVESYEKQFDYLTKKTIVVAGGAAANLKIRESIKGEAEKLGYNFVAPPIKLCTDNAAMIAFAGLERLKLGILNNMDFKPRARWSLEDC